MGTSPNINPNIDVKQFIDEQRFSPTSGASLWSVSW